MLFDCAMLVLLPSEVWFGRAELAMREPVVLGRAKLGTRARSARLNREICILLVEYQQANQSFKPAHFVKGDYPGLDIGLSAWQYPPIEGDRTMPKAKRPKAVHQLTIGQFEAMFPHEDACRAYLQARRWPDGVHCPRCGNPKVYDLASRKWHWQCTQCAPGGSTGYRFSLLVNTIFENTNKPLREWFRVVHMMLTSKKGISALQVKRVMGFGSYETAWSMCHKIRTALIEDIDKLGGIVEVDETYIGGKDKNRHWDKKSGSSGRGDTGKSPVVGAVKRKGNVVARVVEMTDRETLEAFVREAVSTRVSLLCTDDYKGYNRLHFRYK